MLKPKPPVLLALAAAGLAFAGGSGTAEAQNGARVGTLTCTVSGGPGFVITSAKALTCLYRDSRGRRREAYVGTIRKFGLDIGVTGQGTLVWAVWAPTNIIGRGALAGEYAGASGEATVGAGVGAHLLVGGSNQSISLQPLSVQSQTGANIALGVASLTLEPALVQRTRTIIEQR